MRLGSARRTRSPAGGRSAALAQVHPGERLSGSRPRTRVRVARTMPSRTFPRTSTTSSPRKVKRGSKAGEKREKVSMMVSTREFLTGRQLIVNEVHRPSFVRSCRLPDGHLEAWPSPCALAFCCVIAGLTRDRCAGSSSIDRPALASEHHVNTPIAVAHPRLADLLDPLFEAGLSGASRFVVGTPRMRSRARGLGLKARSGPAAKLRRCRIRLCHADAGRNRLSRGRQYVCGRHFLPEQASGPDAMGGPALAPMSR